MQIFSSVVTFWSWSCLVMPRLNLKRSCTRATRPEGISGTNSGTRPYSSRLFLLK